MKTVCASVLLVGGCQAISTRSMTIESAGSPTLYMTYRVRWGWGMSEGFSISRSHWPLTGVSVGQSIDGKPYYSGVMLYRTIDNDFYDFKLGSNWNGSLYRYDVRTSSINSLDLCSFDDRASSRDKHVPRLTATAGSPYFPGRVYLGRFQIEGRGRGEAIAFAPAGKTDEPPLISNECP